MNLCFMLCAAFVVPKKTARRVIDGQTVCRDASQFMLANAVIVTTDKPGKNEELQTPQAVPDLGIQKETPPTAPPDLPDKTANAEKPMEPPGAEIIPEQETGQEEEHNQPAEGL